MWPTLRSHSREELAVGPLIPIIWQPLATLWDVMRTIAGVASLDKGCHGRMPSIGDPRHPRTVPRAWCGGPGPHRATDAGGLGDPSGPRNARRRPRVFPWGSRQSPGSSASTGLPASSRPGTTVPIADLLAQGSLGAPGPGQLVLRGRRAQELPRHVPPGRWHTAPTRGAGWYPPTRPEAGIVADGDDVGIRRAQVPIHDHPVVDHQTSGQGELAMGRAPTPISTMSGGQWPRGR